MTPQGGPMLAASWPNGAALPAPHAANGMPLLPCTRPSCHAMQKHALALARRVEELGQAGAALALERDALRAALDEPIGAADWTPIGGERVMRALTATEARIGECLLLAGRERRPDDGADDAPSGDFRVARYRGILRHTWGPDWDIGDGDRHLLRVNVSRLRHKLRPFGWDVVAVFGRGLRLAPWTGARIPLPPDRPGLHHVRVTAAERAHVLALWEAGYRTAFIATVTGRSPDSIRHAVRAGGGRG